MDRTAVQAPPQARSQPGDAAAVEARTLVTGEPLQVARRFDVAEDDTLALRVDYLEVVARTPSWR